MKARFIWLVCALLVIAPANADIELSPLRQVMTAEKPSATFVVSNPSSRILEGRVSWIDLAVTATGYEPATPDQRPGLSAAPYLVVEPAQFSLKPGERIKVKVKLKKNAKLPRGERRSHLLFETAAARTAIRKASDRGLQIDIGLSVSAPVIVRNGGKAGAEIGETKLLRDENGLLILTTTIIPQGNVSAYGRLFVTHTPRGGKSGPMVLGVRENVAVYRDGPPRNFETPLGQVVLKPGDLELRYEGSAEYAGRLFDSRTFDVAPADE